MARHVAPRVSDHALLRFLDRAGGSDLEQLRAGLEQSLARAYSAARQISAHDFLIQIDGMSYVVRGGTVVTVLANATLAERAHALAPRPDGGK